MPEHSAEHTPARQMTAAMSAHRKQDRPGQQLRPAGRDRGAYARLAARRPNPGTGLLTAGAHAELLQLQETHGNRYVRRLVALDRQETDTAEAVPDVEAAIERARGRGQPMEAGTRAAMESAFGADFEAVRIHTDLEADELNRAISARAFTTGADIFFREGEYDPGSDVGRELLAHELTHVVQQTSTVQGKLTISEPADEQEQEADRVARAVVHRRAVQPDASTEGPRRVSRKKPGAGSKALAIQRDGPVPVILVPPARSELSAPELFEDNINTSIAILENYRTALENFRDVVTFSSDKEAIPKGIGEIALQEVGKFVIEKITDLALEDIPGAKDAVKLGKSILEAVEAEKKRAEEAAVSAALRKFIVSQRTDIGKMIADIDAGRVNWAHDEAKRLAQLSEPAKKTRRDMLIYRNDALTRMKDGSHSPESLFRRLTEGWISAAKSGEKPAEVFIRIDKNWKVVTAHIHAPRGQRLAEQLLRDGGGKFDLNEFRAARTIEYKPQSLDPFDAYVLAEMTAGNTITRIMANYSGEKYVQDFVDKILKFHVPVTTVLTGD